METAENKPGLPGWGVKLLIWCAPTLALILLDVLVLGLVLKRSTVITFCTIPVRGLVLTRLIFLLRSRRSAAAKVWRAALLLVLLFVLFFLYTLMPATFYRRTDQDAQTRFEKELSEAFPDAAFLPLALGTPKSLVYHSYDDVFLFWISRSGTLLCQYDEADYLNEKAELEARCRFRTELLDTKYPFGEQETKKIEPYVTMGDDFFRFLLPEDGTPAYLDSFFKKCLLVVTNDAKHVIGYIFFYDFDMDYVEDLPTFLTECCGWDYIR